MGINKKVTETNIRHSVRHKIVIPYQHTEEDKSEHVIIHFHKMLKMYYGNFYNIRSRTKEKITIKKHFNMIGCVNSSKNIYGYATDKTKDFIEKHMLKEY